MSKRNWCTGFPDSVFSIWTLEMVSIAEICKRHDVRYTDKSKSRWTADLELLGDVMSRGLPIIAIGMWLGVRIFGWYWYNK